MQKLSMPMETDWLHWTGIEFLFNAQKRLYWPYLLVSFLIAIAYLKITRQSISAVLGKNLWWHDSARLDYRYFVVANVISIMLVLPVMLAVPEVALKVMALMEQHLGFHSKSGANYYWLISSYTACLFALNDFTRYWLHRMMHSIPLLWEFHKVHHSAEVLTPLTFYRIHPLESVLFGLRYALSTGLVTGVFIYYFGASLAMIDFLGVNLFVFAAHIVGDNLRHSPVHLSYPGWLENWLISPAQHQYHHTVRGSRTNYGGVLAVWDRLFSSLRIARPDDEYEFGIGAKQRFNSVFDLLFKPLWNILPDRSKNMRPGVTSYSLIVALLGIIYFSPAQSDNTLDQRKIDIGRALFFDQNLSLNRSQSCASCHNPESGFVDSRDNGVNSAASLGDDQQSLGDRNTPTASYAALTPEFHYDSESKQYIGGQFWDGRASNLAEQAKGPPLNKIEMAMPDIETVVSRLQENSLYRNSFKEIFTEDIFTNPDRAYAAMADCIAAFEKTEFFMPFDSKYDRYLRGEYELSDQEDLGAALFFSNNNTNCSSCHLLKKPDETGETFSNYEFHNIGVPVNISLRRKNGMGPNHIDEGLHENEQVNDPKQRGKFKVSTLRNVAVTGPYMHNGIFTDLRTVLEFYDQFNNPKRINNPETGLPWAAAEIGETISREDLKAKKLSDAKIDALIEFLKMLTDQRYEHLL